MKDNNRTATFGNQKDLKNSCKPNLLLVASYNYSCSSKFFQFNICCIAAVVCVLLTIKMLY